jgi:hypothetical protein
MWHVWESEEMHTGFWWGDLKKRGHLEDLGVKGIIIIIIIIIIIVKWVFKK